ncbi:MAG: MBOAT family protein [Lachnospiraceae bacterium]|nr:MBOAT family protein [Lachnospiraceae bacterium]
MIFSSLTFLQIFLPITLLLYYIVPMRFKNAALLLCSLIFYAWGEPVYIILMLYSILLNYVCGLLMENHPRARKQILFFAVLVNLFLLGFFKYAGFLTESFNSIFGRFGLTLPLREIALPIGISFYTFQALSYVIDLYRGKFPVQRNLTRFALYITMFPQLIAGPIVRYESIAEELESRKLSMARFGRGSMQFIEGLAMKVLLANQVGGIADEIRALTPSPAVNAVLSEGTSVVSVLTEGLPVGSGLSTVTAWLGALAYYFQIYFDFAGYSLMAIGLGHMLGFTFIKNFDYPYLSASITEFWRRWHMSLGTWFREYVYIPLGGNRVSAVKHIRNILIVWMLTGLWHGAAWNFVLWGLYYGLLLLLEKYLLSRIRIPKVIGWLYTTVLVIVGWVFFSGENLAQSATILKTMFGMGGSLSGLTTQTAQAMTAAQTTAQTSISHVTFFDQTARYYLSTGWRILLICGICSTPLPRLLRDRLLRSDAGRAVLTVLYVALLALAIMFLVVQNYNPFLYFRF